MVAPVPGNAALDTARRKQVIYGALALAGAVMPLSRLVPWLADNGPDASRFLDELFANRVSGGFALDVLVSAGVILTDLALDGGSLPPSQRCLVAAGTCLVGVSFGLLLSLLLRERRASAVPPAR